MRMLVVSETADGRWKGLGECVGGDTESVDI
jgi:hypothetical protein